SGGATSDVCATVPEHCTVGELADAIADSLGLTPGATLASRWPHDDADRPPTRHQQVSAAGPRAGSTVELVPQPCDGDRPSDAPPETLVVSPVVLVGPDGQRERLHYGA